MGVIVKWATPLQVERPQAVAMAKRFGYQVYAGASSEADRPWGFYVFHAQRAGDVVIVTVLAPQDWVFSGFVDQRRWILDTTIYGTVPNLRFDSTGYLHFTDPARFGTAPTRIDPREGFALVGTFTFLPPGGVPRDFIKNDKITRMEAGSTAWVDGQGALVSALLTYGGIGPDRLLGSSTYAVIFTDGAALKHFQVTPLPVFKIERPNHNDLCYMNVILTDAQLRRWFGNEDLVFDVGIPFFMDSKKSWQPHELLNFPRATSEDPDPTETTLNANSGLPSLRAPHLIAPQAFTAPDYATGKNTSMVVVHPVVQWRPIQAHEDPETWSPFPDIWFPARMVCGVAVERLDLGLTDEDKGAIAETGNSPTLFDARLQAKKLWLYSELPEVTLQTMQGFMWQDSRPNPPTVDPLPPPVAVPYEDALTMPHHVIAISSAFQAPARRLANGEVAPTYTLLEGERPPYYGEQRLVTVVSHIHMEAIDALSADIVRYNLHYTTHVLRTEFVFNAQTKTYSTASRASILSHAVIRPWDYENRLPSAPGAPPVLANYLTVDCPHAVGGSTPEQLYLYKSCGAAVPVSKITMRVYTTEQLREWSNKITSEDGSTSQSAIAFPGEEILSSAEFMLVYPDGDTTTFPLAGMHPPRPVMRGGTWFSVSGNTCSFFYDKKKLADATKTIVPKSPMAPSNWNHDLTGPAMELMAYSSPADAIVTTDVSVNVDHQGAGVAERSHPQALNFMDLVGQTALDAAEPWRLAAPFEGNAIGDTPENHYDAFATVMGKRHEVCSNQAIHVHMQKGLIGVMATALTETSMTVRWKFVTAFESTGRTEAVRGDIFGRDLPLQSSM